MFLCKCARVQGSSFQHVPVILSCRLNIMEVDQWIISEISTVPWPQVELDQIWLVSWGESFFKSFVSSDSTLHWGVPLSSVSVRQLELANSLFCFTSPQKDRHQDSPDSLSYNGLETIGLLWKYNHTIMIVQFSLHTGWLFTVFVGRAAATKT